MKYEPVDPISHLDAEKAAIAASDQLFRIVLAVALHDPDLEWAEAFCEQFSKAPEGQLRGNALLGFGHLARRFQVLDLAKVKPLIEAGLVDDDPWVRGQSESAADDIEFFLGWRFQR